MKILICAIAKCENKYIKEWVQYYKLLSVDNIVLYDNNELNGEHFEDIISDEINSKFVLIKNVRGVISTPELNLQTYVYTKCYNEYSDMYDWIIYIDIDEYITIEKSLNLKSFLSNPMYNNFNCIRLFWKNYTDNNIITSDNNYSINRFSEYNNDVSGKSIIRTKLLLTKPIGAHGSRSAVPVCNVLGEEITYNKKISVISNKPIYNISWINHYKWKSLEEFINKMERGYPDMAIAEARKKITFDEYFKNNKITKEKLKYIKDRGYKYIYE